MAARLVALGAGRLGGGRHRASAAAHRGPVCRQAPQRPLARAALALVRVRGSSGGGPILRNCLFIERSRKTSATPSAATTRKPSRPGSTSLIVEELLSWRSEERSKGHTLPDTREKVIFRQLGIDERPSKMIVLGRPRGALDVARAGEP